MKSLGNGLYKLDQEFPIRPSVVTEELIPALKNQDMETVKREVLLEAVAKHPVCETLLFLLMSYSTDETGWVGIDSRRLWIDFKSYFDMCQQNSIRNRINKRRQREHAEALNRYETICRVTWGVYKWLKNPPVMQKATEQEVADQISSQPKNDRIMGIKPEQALSSLLKDNKVKREVFRSEQEDIIILSPTPESVLHLSSLVNKQA